MPYVDPETRARIDGGGLPQTSGELNYALTRAVQSYLCRDTNHLYSYEQINAAIGALECCKLELYRRIAAPYEDKKIQRNGDVYQVPIT